MLKKTMSAKEAVANLAAVVNKESQELIIRTYKAIEGFVMCSCIVLGILQMAALLFTNEINNSCPRWLRTYSNSTPSEETTLVCLDNSYPRIFKVLPKMAITEIINSKIDEHIDYFEDTA